jgi:hypothetical protein
MVPCVVMSYETLNSESNDHVDHICIAHLLHAGCISSDPESCARTLRNGSSRYSVRGFCVGIIPDQNGRQFPTVATRIPAGLRLLTKRGAFDDILQPYYVPRGYSCARFNRDPAVQQTMYGKVRAVYGKCNLEIKDPIHYRGWCGEAISELLGLDPCFQSAQGVPRSAVRLITVPSASQRRSLRRVWRTNFDYTNRSLRRWVLR